MNTTNFRGDYRTRGADLATALTDAGFDPRDLAQQAGVGRGDGPPPPPPPGGGQGSKSPESEDVKTLQSIVEQLKEITDADDTESDFSTLLKQALEEAGLDTSQPILDFRV